MSHQDTIIDQELFQLTEEEQEQIQRSKWQIIKAQIASFIYVIVLVINAVIESYIGSYGLRFYLLVGTSILFLAIAVLGSRYPKAMLSTASVVALLFLMRHIFWVEEPGLANIAWTGILILILLLGLMHAQKIRKIRKKLG